MTTFTDRKRIISYPEVTFVYVEHTHMFKTLFLYPQNTVFKKIVCSISS